MSLAENRDRPVLLHVTGMGLHIDCHATGETGPCGHPLAECPDPGCPGSMCATCGEWLCAEHQAFRDAFQKLLGDGAARLADASRWP